MIQKDLCEECPEKAVCVAELFNGSKVALCKRCREKGNYDVRSKAITMW